MVIFSKVCVGTKGVAREMKKICSGTRREEGITWFTELSDKGKQINKIILCFATEKQQ